jgi:UDP-N-acetyl-D-galactosamine dehydrogenase
MINAGVALKGARVGIVGVTFKENVTDTRNSRVPDIAWELHQFGIEPVLHDPIADGDEFRAEYGLPLRPWQDLRGVQGLVVAVGHDDFRKRSAREIADVIAPGGVLVDVKSLLTRESLPEHISYWSL